MICMRLYKFCNTKNQHQKHQHFYVSNCTNTALLKIMAQKHDSVLSTSSLLQRKNYYGYYHLYLFIVICYVSFFIYATEIIWITDIIKVVIISVSPNYISKRIQKDNLQTEVPQCQMCPKYIATGKIIKVSWIIWNVIVMIFKLQEYNLKRMYLIFFA